MSWCTEPVHFFIEATLCWWSVKYSTIFAKQFVIIFTHCKQFKVQPWIMYAQTFLAYIFNPAALHMCWPYARMISTSVRTWSEIHTVQLHANRALTLAHSRVRRDEKNRIHTTPKETLQCARLSAIMNVANKHLTWSVRPQIIQYENVQWNGKK